MNEALGLITMVLRVEGAFPCIVWDRPIGFLPMFREALLPSLGRPPISIAPKVESKSNFTVLLSISKPSKFDSLPAVLRMFPPWSRLCLLVNYAEFKSLSIWLSDIELSRMSGRGERSICLDCLCRLSVEISDSYFLIST